MSPVLVDTDARVREWVEEIVGGIEVVDDPPGPTSGGGEPPDSLSVYLLGVVHESSPRVDVRQPGSATVWMRYLICGTRRGATALTAIDALFARLLDLATASPGDLEVMLEPAADLDRLWSVFDTTPRAGVVVRVRSRFDRRAIDAPPVLVPLRVLGGPVRSLTGRVLGPGEIPMVDVEVAVPSVGARARTGANGAFTLASLPAGPLSLAVWAKGRSFEVAVGEIDEPLTIRCDPTEASS